jgi:hypothetical protein
VSPEIAARLESRGIVWFATEKGYTMFTRENCAAIAHARPEADSSLSGGYSVGSSGIMTESGFAYLLWRDDRPFLAAHGAEETPADPAQVEALRRFAEDLKQALAR